MHPLDLAVVGAYLAFTVGVGVWVSRRFGGFEGFFLAGRSMTTPMLVCTLASTFYGVDVLFGTSELAYEEGVVAWFTYSRPMYLFLLIAAFLLAGRLRGSGMRSLPDLVAREYGRPAQVVVALASFVYALPSLGLFGLGMVWSVLFGGEPWVGALVFGGIALLYTIQGGLLADALTDTVQFVLMCVTLAIAVPIAMSTVGGFEAVEAASGPEFFEPLGTLSPWLALVYASTGLVVFVEPAFYQRIFASRSARDVRRALLIGIVFWAAYDWCVTAGGMLASAAVDQGLLPADLHPDEALLRVVLLVLPVGLGGLFLAGVLAAEMSTTDSYCLVAGGNLAYDLWRPAHPEADDATLVRLTRVGILVSWVVGFVVAFLFETLLSLWVFLATLLMASALVPVLAALLRPGRNVPLAGTAAAIAGLTGAVAVYVLVWWFGEWNEEFATIIWTIDLPGGPLEIWQEYAMLFAVPLSALAFVTGSFVGRPRP